MEKELLEQEEREAQEQNEGGDRTASGLKSLLPGQKRPIGEELQDPDTKEFFIERLSESLIRYGAYGIPQLETSPRNTRLCSAANSFLTFSTTLTL